MQMLIGDNWSYIEAYDTQSQQPLYIGYSMIWQAGSCEGAKNTMQMQSLCEIKKVLLPSKALWMHGMSWSAARQ